MALSVCLFVYMLGSFSSSTAPVVVRGCRIEMLRVEGVDRSALKHIEGVRDRAEESHEK